MTTRTLATALDYWPSFNGWCISQGVDCQELHPADFCDLVYYWLSKDLEAKERHRLDMDLTTPPANIAPSEDDPMWSDDALLASWGGLQK